MIVLDQKFAVLLDRTSRSPDAATAGIRLCFEVLALARAIDGDCAMRLGQHGLSEGKFVLLFLLDEAEDGLSPHELATRAGVTRGTITGLLDGLERAELVRRGCHEADRRRLTVRLTAPGKALTQTLVAEHGQWIGSLFAGLSGDERETLRRLLTKAFARTGTGIRHGGVSDEA